MVRQGEEGGHPQRCCFVRKGTRELLHKRWRGEGRKEGRQEGRESGGQWGRGGGRRHQGLVGQLLPQGPDMRDTFILTGRVTPESNEEQTGSINEGQTLSRAAE